MKNTYLLKTLAIMMTSMILTVTPVQAKPHIECYTEDSLTVNALRSRKADQAIVIEEVRGKVLTSTKIGKTTCGKSISYKNVAGARKGSLISTFKFYNPDNTRLDSVNLRMDYVGIYPDIKVVNYATKAMRVNRKNKYILIERIVGEITTSNKKGRDTRGRVVDYRKVPGVRKGDIIISYRVYANSNQTTDVARRYDFIYK